MSNASHGINCCGWANTVLVRDFSHVLFKSCLICVQLHLSFTKLNETDFTAVEVSNTFFRTPTPFNHHSIYSVSKTETFMLHSKPSLFLPLDLLPSASIYGSGNLSQQRKTASTEGASMQQKTSLDAIIVMILFFCSSSWWWWMCGAPKLRHTRASSVSLVLFLLHTCETY